MNNSENIKKPLPGHYSKAHPCHVLLKEKVLATHPRSSKQTYHISLDIKNTDIQFEPGDSIGILPQNDPVLVRKFLELVDSKPTESMIDPRSQEEMSVESYLLHKVNLSRINSSLLKLFLAESKTISVQEKLSFLLDSANKHILTEFLYGKDLTDILKLFQEKAMPISVLAPHFTPILPRFYSISSSLNSNPQELHLLVALLSYLHGNELRFGVASHFLCHLAREMETSIPIYVQPAAHFQLPEDSSQNLIMIGPGTGVAPYRAFLQERVYQKATGKHWLFFGERNREYDFFYESYWKDLENQGILRLSTAFSRDQDNKEYVQHKIAKHAKELWEWISSGSYLYVCGNASHMAKDVETTLLSIFSTEGKMSEVEAKTYLKGLRVAKRYLTDVY